MAFNTLVLGALLSYQILPPQPSIDSANRIDFFGNIYEQEGIVGFSGLDPSTLNYGHIEINKNALAVNASYYVTGREGSPEPGITATRSGSGTEITGYTNFSNYLTSNGIALNDVGYSFSPKSGTSVTETWNLGDDILGEDWYATPESSLEELIYQANPNDVQIGLLYNDTKIIDFSYSDLFVAADTGPTKAFEDDSFFVFTKPITATKTTGLGQLEDDLADAFLEDVADLGGQVKIIWNSPTSPEGFDFITTDRFGVQYFSIPASIQPVPEPSSALGILALGFLGGVFLRKKQKAERIRW